MSKHIEHQSGIWHVVSERYGEHEGWDTNDYQRFNTQEEALEHKQSLLGTEYYDSKGSALGDTQWQQKTKY